MVAPRVVYRWLAITAAGLAASCRLGPLTAEGSGSSGGESGSSEATGAVSSTAAMDTGTAESEGTTGATPANNCDGAELRVASFNVRDVGAVGSDEFVELAASLYRIDADVVCLQEVAYYESAQLGAVAAMAGYTTAIKAERSPAIGGEIGNACLGQVPLQLVGSWTGDELSSDPNANDLGRDILAVRAELTPTCHATVFTVHLKSGFEYVDTFRRQVEVERLAVAIERYREQRPDEPIFVVGDFNEQIDDAAIGAAFSSPPEGLPESYRLGNDIVLPLVYQPFERIAGLGFTIAHPTWEDSSFDTTWNEQERLDYILFAGADRVGDEVYNSCEDNGVDDAPAGAWLPKRGDPLACYVSLTASDHLPLMFDAKLP